MTGYYRTIELDPQPIIDWVHMQEFKVAPNVYPDGRCMGCGGQCSTGGSCYTHGCAWNTPTITYIQELDGSWRCRHGYALGDKWYQKWW